MFVCYTSVSGVISGNDERQKPFVVFVGVLSDQATIHVVQDELAEVIAAARRELGVPFEQVGVEGLYFARPPWTDVKPEARARLFGEVFHWVATRRQKLVVSAIDTARFEKARQASRLPEGVNSAFALGALHIALIVQRANQTYAANEGRTVLLFQENGGPTEEVSQLLFHAPQWTDEFYGYNRGPRLSHIVDTAYFVHPRTPSYLHVAAYAAVVLRRRAELTDAKMDECFPGERQQVDEWAGILRLRCLPKRHVLPNSQDHLTDLFRSVLPASIANLLP